MRKSKNYEMNLFDEGDFYSAEQFNENTEKIDEVLESLENPEHDTRKQAEVEELASGESLKVALRKLAKAVKDLISHLADKVVHITSNERTLWNTVSNKADSNHTHKYAGSSSAGGAANSANKLNTNAGSVTQPVYFKDGIPVATTYTLGKSVPADAKFTDTTYSALKNPTALTVQANGTSLGTYDGSSAKTFNITPSNIGASASNHTHNYAGSSSAGGAATTALECTGNASSATKLQTARKINGVEFDGAKDINVVDDTAYQKLSCKMDKVGWYRIFIGTGTYFNSILHFVRSWETLTPETVTLKLSLGVNGLDVSVLSHYGAIHIDKIRLVQQSVSNAYNKQRYIDLHYNADTGGTVSMLSYDNEDVRAFKLNTDLSETDATLNITPDELEEGYTSTEIDISERGSYFPKSKIDELTVGSISGVNYAGSSSAGGAANSAKKLSSTRYIDGIPFDGSSNLSRLGTCATASYDTAKKVTIGAFDEEGASDAILYIQFTGAYNGGAKDTHTISINDGEQLVIYYQGAVFKWETFFSNYPFCDGQIHQFRYFWSPTGSYLELITPSNRAVANNLTTTDEKIALAAPMGKQLAETDASLQEQISTLNSNKLTGAFKQYRYTGSITEDVAVEIATIGAYDKIISISLICCATLEKVYDGGSVYINSSGKLMYVPKSTSTRSEIRVSVITKA